MKNKNAFPILLLASIFIISGCSNTQVSSSSYNEGDSSSSSSSSSDPSTSSSNIPGGGEGEETAKEIQVEMDASLRAEGSSTDPYNLTFTYDDEFFVESAKTYDKDLSMLSFASSVATATKERGTKFFSDINFENVAAHGYDAEPTKDSMGYFFAHKSIRDFELVAVGFRGFNYGLEWANNFTIGKTGDHEGFAARGQEAYQELQSYINTYAKNKTLKLWINGYSRAGAVSHVLTSLILKGDKVNVAQDNMFVYTFEAPASLCEENALEYENVHNIINDVDLITYIPPESYGLKRCGVEYDIYDANASTLVKEFDETIEFPEFVAISGITDEPMESDSDVLDFVLNSVFNKDEDADPDVYANTREQYVDNYQAGLSSCIGYIFGLKESTRTELLTALKDMGFGAIAIIGDDTGASLMDFMKTYLDKDNVSYDEEQLLADCAIFIKGVTNLFMQVLLMFLLDDYSPDITRLIDMHYPETTYVLLNNAHSKVVR